ncbi:MAG: 6-pyruvoyl-tetrahydropterin synthase-related protein [Anaerolineae bacterium]
MDNLGHRFKHLDLALLVALVLPVVAILPLLTHAGLPNTADGPAHLMRQVELNQAWQHGLLYPRWAADLAFGHGMPLFNYAPPALYQLTQLLHLTGLPLDAAMKGSLIVDFLLYSLGAFLFVRRIYGAQAGLVAAAAYVYAPYRLREAFIQGNYGQFTGLAFYPLVLWGFHGLLTGTRPRRYILPAALSLGGLLLSHNISAMLFAPLFVAYLAFLWIVYRPLKKPAFVLRQSSFAILLALGLSAFFWLPAFGERGQIRLEGITQGFFDFRANFITLAELIAPPRPLDLAAINPHFPLALGIGQLAGATLAALLLVAGLARAARRDGAVSTHLGRPANLHLIFFGVILPGYAFLVLPASQFLWETVPLLALAEFPWRMLGPALLAAAVLCGGAFHRLTEARAGHRGGVILVVAILALVIANVTYLVPAQFIRWGTPSPAEAVAYEVASGAIGTTSTGEFLPRWADRFPAPQTLQPDYEAGRPPQKLDPQSLPPGARGQMLSHLPQADSLRLETPRPFEAVVRTLYWPGWQALLDGQPVPITVTRPGGLIQVPVPAGAHLLELRLNDTPLRAVAEAISALSVIFAALIAVASARNRLRGAPTPAPNPGLALRPPQALVLLIALLVTAATLQILAGRFQMRSDPDRPLVAKKSAAIDFGDQVRLVGFDPGPALVRPGDRLAVVAYWRALQPLDTDYAVFLHLDDPSGRTRLTFDERHPDDIPTSRWPPGLYLRQPMTLSIPPDLPPIRYDLNVGLYDPTNDRRLPPASGAGESFTLGQVWIAPQTPASSAEIPRLSEPVRFGPHIALLGAAWQAGDGLSLYWQADAPPEKDYTIFVHFLDGAGNILAQSDSAPYGGLYPTGDWRPGQIILDLRSAPGSSTDLSRLATIAIGLYDPASGERLPAIKAKGGALPDNAYHMPLIGN